MAYFKIQEEELKNRVAKDWFNKFNWTRIIGKIDFCVTEKKGEITYLWAEAKAGKKDIYESFVQLILTIGKARTIDVDLPPLFLGAFNAEKIAFLPYHAIMEVFSKNDFNWNVTPSDHSTKEFKQLDTLVHTTLERESLFFDFSKDKDTLAEFISLNFVPDNPDINRICITKNNFIFVYNDWVKAVKPSIVLNWEHAKQEGILDADFYLADLLSQDNLTLKDKLYVVLKNNHYEFARSIDQIMGSIDKKETAFRDGQKAHKKFWQKYMRPPAKEYWEYIIERRDYLVPQDVRERKGSYFTPSKWVKLSQAYLAKTLGENWQDEYYIWDCAAGTGNLLAGLTNKYNIWASTIDQADVDVLKDRIANGANLLENHVFKFDFLNDSFDNLPKGLKEIIEDSEKRKKLVVYINPPYAEGTNSKTRYSKTSRNKPGVSQAGYYTYNKFKSMIGRGINEVYVQFLLRIYSELHGCIIANFSTLKIIQSVNFDRFREYFQAKLISLFVIPSYTFDNVDGEFSIGFYHWDTSKQIKISETFEADVYDEKGSKIRKKSFFCPKTSEIIMHWLQDHYDKFSQRIAYVVRGPSDFQNNNMVFITLQPSKAMFDNSRTHDVTAKNLIVNSIFLAIRRIMPADWTNKSDSYLYPYPTWERDHEFQNDCLAWTLFNNNISCEHGVNHWIPFTESEVNAKDKFSSHFMTDYISGKLGDKGADRQTLTDGNLDSIPNKPLEFSEAAKAVFEAGKAIWTYYHKQHGANPNAALYDIKAHFQGRNEKGRMNAKSDDDEYNGLMGNLREKLKALAEQIEPKIYEHGFLKR